MSIIIRLQNLPWSANSVDIRHFFSGLSIPEGGVHIVGGEMGDAFIAFSTDEDARLAMAKDGGKIKDMQIKLLLSSRTEMMRVIEQARQQNMVVAQPHIVSAQPALLALQQPARILTPSSDSERRRGRSPSPHHRSRDRSPLRDRRRSPDERRSSKRERSRSPSRSSRNFPRDMDRRSDRFKRDDRHYDDSRYRDERRSARDSPQEPKRYLDADHVNSRSQLHATEGFRNMPNVHELTHNIAMRGAYPYGNQQSQSNNFPDAFMQTSIGSSPKLPQTEQTNPQKLVDLPNFIDQKSTLYPLDQVPFRSPFETSVPSSKESSVSQVDQQMHKPRRRTRFEPEFVSPPSASLFSASNVNVKPPVSENSQEVSSYSGRLPHENYSEARNTWPRESKENSSWNEKHQARLNPPVSKNEDFLQVVPMDLDPSPSDIAADKEIFQESAPVRGPNPYDNNNSISRDDNLRRENQIRGPPEHNEKSSSMQNEGRGPANIGNERNRPANIRNEGRGPENMRNEGRGPENIHNEGRGPENIRNEGRGPENMRNEGRGINSMQNDSRGPSDVRNERRGPPGTHNDSRGPPGIHNERRGPPGLYNENKGPGMHGENRAPNMHNEGRDPSGRHNENRGPPGRHNESRGPPGRHNEGRGPVGRHNEKRESLMHGDVQGHGPPSLTVEVRGLSPDARIDDILDLFRGIPLPAANVRIEANDQGFEKAIIRFVSVDDFEEALSRNRRFTHEGRCELVPCPASSFDNVSRPSKPKPKLKPREEDLTIQLRGLPFSCNDDDVVRFFDGLGILDLYVDIAPDGRASGMGYVEFATNEDFRAALTMNGKMIGHRYITVSVASKEMMAFARGEDYSFHSKGSRGNSHYPNTGHPPNQSNQGRPAPASGQIRPLMNPGRPLPSNNQGRGPPPPCISLKGLPEGVTNRDIAGFLGERGIMPRAVHIMLRPDKTPSGDAFVEFGGPADMDMALEMNGKPMHGKRILIQPISFFEMSEILGRPSPMPPPPVPTPLLRTPGDCDRPRRPLLPQGPNDGPYRERPRMEPPPNRGPRPLLESGRRMQAPWPNRSFNGGNRPDARFPPPPTERGIKDFGSPGCVVSINNLHFRAGLEELLDFFHDYKITKDNIIRKYNENGQTTGEARVAFQTPRDAQRAVRDLNHKSIMGRPLTLSVL